MLLQKPSNFNAAEHNLLNLTQTQKILITRSKEGMTLFEKVNGEEIRKFAFSNIGL